MNASDIIGDDPSTSYGVGTPNEAKTLGTARPSLNGIGPNGTHSSASFREEVDPTYDGDARAGTPFCPEGTGPRMRHRYRPITVPGGTHVDGFVPLSPTLCPMLPTFVDAVTALEAWTT